MNQEILNCNKSISGLESMASYHRANIIYVPMIAMAVMGLLAVVMS